MKWTEFWDMHSGGGAKEKWENIYIEAGIEDAKTIFYNRFGHNPDRVTCTCCGPDYSISESADLAQASGFQRGCKWEGEASDDAKYVEEQNPHLYLKTYMTLEDFKNKEDVLVIPASEITARDSIGEVPQQGYVWMGD